MTRLRWVLAGVGLLVALAVIGPFVYINFIQDDPPDRLSLDDVATSTTAPSSVHDGVDGTWTVGAGSRAGYRVKEVLFGQDTEAVGRTEDVTGTMEIADSAVRSANFTVDLTTVASDESRRDGQFQGRIMDTARFPTASFTLTSPIDLSSVDADGARSTVTATGDFTIRGITRSVTFDLEVARTGSSIAVNGTIDVAFADFGIPNPSFGPASVGDRGEIEVLLVLS